MHREHITFMIVPENRQDPWKLRMTKRLFNWLLGVFGVLLIVFFIGVFFGGKYIGLVFEKRTLLAENQNLRKQLSKVERLEYKLGRINEMEVFLRRILEENAEDETPLSDEEIQEIVRGHFSAKSIDKVQARSRYIPRGLPQNGAITSMHGSDNPLFEDDHKGVDIALPPGKAVYSTAAGKVVFADYTRDLGFLVVIDHTNGYTTKYGHLKKTTVNKDDFIDRNTIVGFSGATGKSIGTHIHYEILKDGKQVNPIETRKTGEGEIDGNAEKVVS